MTACTLDIAPSSLRNVPPITKLAEAAKPKIATDYFTLPRVDHIPHDAIVKFLGKVASEYRADKTYMSIRKRYIALSLALNKLGLLAPAFRNQPRLPFSSARRSSEQTQMLVDQIVIDCHWLHCRKEHIETKFPELTEILRPQFESPRVLWRQIYLS